jgi:hypothetical protein
MGGEETILVTVLDTLIIATLRNGLLGINPCILQIATKTDLSIKLAPTERSKQRRVVALKFLIKTQAESRRPDQFATEASGLAARTGIEAVFQP